MNEDQPVAHEPPPIPAPAPPPVVRSRRGAFADMILRDHGFFRYAYLNLHAVGAGARLWRSAQPAPHHLRRIHRRLGIRTIINLRGQNPYGSYQLEWETCRELGIRLVNFPVKSRSAPEPHVIAGIDDLFAHVEPPILVHCKSGADRAGLASALYLALREGRPVPEAARQLSLRFGHVRQAKTGMLDFFFSRYLAEGSARGLSFREWVRGPYDHAATEAAFHEQWVAGILIDKVLRRE